MHLPWIPSSSFSTSQRKQTVSVPRNLQRGVPATEKAVFDLSYREALSRLHASIVPLSVDRTARLRSASAERPRSVSNGSISRDGVY